MSRSSGTSAAAKNTAGLQQFQEEGRKRLHPSLTDPNWLVLRKRREIFAEWLRQIDQKDLIVLDVGGRIQPYRPLVQHRVSRYIAVDLVITPLINVAADAASMPIRDACADLVICTQMLEYAPQPQKVIDEIYRVLKPGGYLMLSVPAIYPQDSDHDRWRFLPGALTVLLQEYSSVDVNAEGTSLTGIIRTINVWLTVFSMNRIVRSLLSFTVVPALNLLGAVLENINFTRNTSFTANFSVLARK